MGILSWIVFGLIAGALAKWIMPGKNEPQGCIVTIILGIVGAVTAALSEANYWEPAKWTTGA